VRKIITGLFAIVIVAGMGAFAWKACATDEPPKQTEEKPTGDAGKTSEAAAGGDCCKAGDETPPLDLVKATPKGGLHNPYADKVTDAAFAEEGHKAYLSAGCNGCHGSGGGGGMCPPLMNDTWVYDGDDDTLFRLVTLGSDELQKAGYTRHGHENVVGPMPPFGALIKSGDELWKIITFVRSKYSSNADQAYKYGTPADQK